MKIAIIVINYNNKFGLQKTLSSISEQGPLSCISGFYEVIAVDGSSTDGSLDVIKKYSSLINLNWTSEEDFGIYNAMNKGLERLASRNCTHFIFLNSGDYFSSIYSVSKIINAIKSNEGYNILFFKAKNFYKNLYNFRPSSLEEKVFENHVNSEYFPCHQGVLCSTAIINEFSFDENLSISADTKFLKAVFANNRSKYIPEHIVDFELGGISSYYKNFSHCLRHAQEKCYKEGSLSRKDIAKIYFFCFGKYLLGKIVGQDNYFRFYFGVKKLL